MLNRSHHRAKRNDAQPGELSSWAKVASSKQVARTTMRCTGDMKSQTTIVHMLAALEPSFWQIVSLSLGPVAF